MPAAIGLGEVRREPVGPAVRLLEQVDRRRDVVRLGAAGAIAAPLVANLRLGMTRGEVARAEAADAGGAEQQRIFDPRANARQPLGAGSAGGSAAPARRAAASAARAAARRRRRARAAAQRPGSSAMVTTVGSNALHRMRVSPPGSSGHVDDRGAAGQRELDDLAGPAAAARRQAVPHRDQHVAMRDGRAAGHDVGVEPVGRIAGQFEQAAGALDQRVEPFARAVVGEARAISGALERQDRLQAPSQARARPPRRSGRRHRRLARRSAAARAQRRSSRAPFRAGRAPALAISRQRSRRFCSEASPRLPCGEHVGAMASDPYAEHERNGRRRTARSQSPPAPPSMVQGVNVAGPEGYLMVRSASHRTGDMRDMPAPGLRRRPRPS